MKQTIPVIGMACASCSANIERKLNELDGINEASVSLPGRSALVDYDPEKISLEKMKSEINGIGYDLVIDKQTSVEEVEKRAYTLLKRKTLLSWMFSVAVMCVSMQWINLGSRDISNQVSLLIALANMLYCGRQFYVTYEAVITWYCKYGYSCCFVNRNSLLVQYFQHFWEMLYGRVVVSYGTPISMLR